MAAYIIGRIEVTDPEAYKEYIAKVPDTVQRHGGRYLVRGGASEVLEGSMPDRRTVCLELRTARLPSVGTTPPSTFRFVNCAIRRQSVICSSWMASEATALADCGPR